jgi:hypothetical protein
MLRCGLRVARYGFLYFEAGKPSHFGLWNSDFGFYFLIRIPQSEIRNVELLAPAL